MASIVLYEVQGREQSIRNPDPGRILLIETSNTARAGGWWVVRCWDPYQRTCCHKHIGEEWTFSITRSQIFVSLLDIEDTTICCVFFRTQGVGRAAPYLMLCSRKTRHIKIVWFVQLLVVVQNRQRPLAHAQCVCAEKKGRPLKAKKQSQFTCGLSFPPQSVKSSRVNVFSTDWFRFHPAVRQSWHVSTKHCFLVTVPTKVETFLLLANGANAITVHCFVQAELQSQSIDVMDWTNDSVAYIWFGLQKRRFYLQCWNRKLESWSSAALSSVNCTNSCSENTHLRLSTHSRKAPRKCEKHSKQKLSVLKILHPASLGLSSADSVWHKVGNRVRILGLVKLEMVTKCQLPVKGAAVFSSNFWQE